jgi:hypothetical protein
MRGGALPEAAMSRLWTRRGREQVRLAGRLERRLDVQDVGARGAPRGFPRRASQQAMTPGPGVISGVAAAAREP